MLQANDFASLTFYLYRLDELLEKEGQTVSVHRSEVIDRSHEQKNILKIRKHSVKRADRKMVKMLLFDPKKIFFRYTQTTINANL